MNKIIKLGNPILRTQSDLIDEKDFDTIWLKDLIKELFAVMAETGGVGVAAPQIGENKQVLVFSTGYTKRRKPEINIPDTVLVNPQIEILDDTQISDYEGCLSLGEIMAIVPRAMKIRYTGLDAMGNEMAREAEGLEARIVQHEVDHLNGVLFIDRVVDTQSMTFYSEFQKRQAE